MHTLNTQMGVDLSPLLSNQHQGLLTVRISQQRLVAHSEQQNMKQAAKRVSCCQKMSSVTPSKAIKVNRNIMHNIVTFKFLSFHCKYIQVSKTW